MESPPQQLEAGQATETAEGTEVRLWSPPGKKLGATCLGMVCVALAVFIVLVMIWMGWMLLTGSVLEFDTHKSLALSGIAAFSLGVGWLNRSWLQGGNEIVLRSDSWCITVLQGRRVIRKLELKLDDIQGIAATGHDEQSLVVMVGDEWRYEWLGGGTDCDRAWLRERMLDDLVDRPAFQTASARLTAIAPSPPEDRHVEALGDGTWRLKRPPLSVRLAESEAAKLMLAIFVATAGLLAFLWFMVKPGAIPEVAELEFWRWLLNPMTLGFSALIPVGALLVWATLGAWSDWRLGPEFVVIGPQAKMWRRRCIQARKLSVIAFRPPSGPREPRLLLEATDGRLINMGPMKPNELSDVVAAGKWIAERCGIPFDTPVGIV